MCCQSVPIQMFLHLLSLKATYEQNYFCMYINNTETWNHRQDLSSTIENTVQDTSAELTSSYFQCICRVKQEACYFLKRYINKCILEVLKQQGAFLQFIWNAPSGSSIELLQELGKDGKSNQEYIT